MHKAVVLIKRRMCGEDYTTDNQIYFVLSKNVLWKADTQSIILNTKSEVLVYTDY